jgi:hypothetical protein
VIYIVSGIYFGVFSLLGYFCFALGWAGGCSCIFCIGWSLGMQRYHDILWGGLYE